MWVYIAVFFIGVSAGMVLMFYMRKSEVGDDYQIIKPKVRGKGNELKVDQQNIVKKAKDTVDKKIGLIKRIKTKRALKKASKIN